MFPFSAETKKKDVPPKKHGQQIPRWSTQTTPKFGNLSPILPSDGQDKEFSSSKRTLLKADKPDQAYRLMECCALYRSAAVHCLDTATRPFLGAERQTTGPLARPYPVQIAALRSWAVSRRTQRLMECAINTLLLPLKHQLRSSGQEEKDGPECLNRPWTNEGDKGTIP